MSQWTELKFYSGPGLWEVLRVKYWIIWEYFTVSRLDTKVPLKEPAGGPPESADGGIVALCSQPSL